MKAMEKAVDEKLRGDTEKAWQQAVQQEADEGRFTTEIETLSESDNPLIRRAMELVGAAGELSNLASAMQSMEELHPDFFNGTNDLIYQIALRNFRFSLQLPGRGFNMGITRAHQPYLDELYHIEISTEGRHKYEDLHCALFTDDGQIVDALDFDDSVLAEVLHPKEGDTSAIEENRRKAQKIAGEIESVLSSPDWMDAAREHASKKVHSSFIGS